MKKKVTHSHTPSQLFLTIASFAYISPPNSSRQCLSLSCKVGASSHAGAEPGRQPLLLLLLAAAGHMRNAFPRLMCASVCWRADTGRVSMTVYCKINCHEISSKNSCDLQLFPPSGVNEARVVILVKSHAATLWGGWRCKLSCVNLHFDVFCREAGWYENIFLLLFFFF